MFIFSLKFKKKYLLFLLIPLLIFIFVFFHFFGKSKTDASNFLSSYGFQNEFVEEKEIFIPYEFPDFYINYNNLQKKQGFDLSKYKGKKCKKIRFLINNYSDDTVADVLMFGTKIIGGDIHIKSYGESPLPFNIMSCCNTN